MNRVMIFFLAFILVLCVVQPFTACAADEADVRDEITQEIEGVLADYDLGIAYEDITDMSFSEISELIVGKLTSRLTAPMHMLTVVFLVVVLSAVIKNTAGGVLNGTSGELYSMVSVISAVTVTAPQLMEVYSDTLTDIELCGSFILVFVPVFSAAALLSGGFTTAGAYHMLMLGASELFVELSDNWLLPVLGTTAALAAAGSVFPDSSLESISSFLKKGVTFAVTAAMTLFTGFVGLKCTICGKADGAAAKTAKMLVSSAVPIVGGAVSDAYATIKGSFEVIGGTVGAAGIIGVVILLLPKILEIFIYRGVMCAGAAAADLFSVKAVSKLLKSFDSGLAIAQCILISYSLMFIISSAIIAQTIG